jgi:hypothetical protein
VPVKTRRRLVASASAAVTLASVWVAAAYATTIAGGDLHNARYCEVIELRGLAPDATATVWNTIGLNKCPPRKWDSLAAGPLAKQLGATLVVLNGPRHFLMDSASAVAGGIRDFDGLRAREVATIPIHSVADLVQTPYHNRIIARTNSWTWNRGRTVFELVAPGGHRYVMQSYSQIVDPKLTLAQLPSLGHRLHLPKGWRYETRRLRCRLVLRAKGKATITQDELQDTYQLIR